MNHAEHLERIRAHYRPLLAEHGDTHRVVGWRHEELQTIRFMVLNGIGRLSSAAVLDIGCGVGHMVDWLEERDFRGEYVGIDLQAEMVERARARHPGRRFEVANLLEPGAETWRADYVVANGIFHLATEDIIEETVTAMFHACRLGVAFNVLSTWYDKPDPAGFPHHDPYSIMQRLRKLTSWQVLRHDYLPQDFTIYLYRR